MSKKLFKSILLSAVLASAATVSAKTEVMVFFDAEDFTSDRANDTIRDLANLCTEEGGAVRGRRVPRPRDNAARLTLHDATGIFATVDQSIGWANEFIAQIDHT